MKKKALITGISGQDGSYLAEYLLELGYEVHGLVRRNSSFVDHPNLKNVRLHAILHYSDLTDSTNIRNIINEVQPDEIYNLAAQSHVAVSFELPEYTADVDGLGALRILDTIRALGLTKKIKYYQVNEEERKIIAEQGYITNKKYSRVAFAENILKISKNYINN